MQKTAQQSVHPTLGILAKSQAFFYASAFFQSDGVPPPAPARAMQAVRWPIGILFHQRCVTLYYEYFMKDEYRRNHYVPEWYQKCFFSSEHTSGKFFYLNLYPDSFIDKLGIRTHTQLRHFGPPSCFKEDDLYTTKFGGMGVSKTLKKGFSERLTGKAKKRLNISRISITQVQITTPLKI